MTVIETPRLLLREATADDLDALARIYADPEVMRYIGLGGTRTREEVIAQVEWMMASYRVNGFGLWTTVLKEDGRIIGRNGLLIQRIDGRLEAEVAYLVDRPCWGQGLGSEAAAAVRDYARDELNLQRLIALIYPQNQRSQGVARRLGMAYEKDISYRGITVQMYGMG